MTLPFMALVQRDLLRTLRRKRTAVFVAALMGACAFVIATRWPGQGFSLFYGVSFYQEEMVAGSVRLWRWAAAIILPVHAAAYLPRERSSGGYDALTLTGIHPLGFVLGILINTLGLFFLAFLACVPLYSALYFLIGTDPKILLAVFLVVTSTSFAFASIGAFCSASFKNTVAAVVAAVILSPMLMGGPYVLLNLLDDSHFFDLYRIRAYMPDFAIMLWSFCPYIELVVSDPISLLPYLLASGLHLLMGLSLIVAAVWFLWRQMRRRTDSGLASWFSRVRHRFFGPDIVPFPPIPDEIDPMLERETRWRVPASRPWVSFFILIPFFLCCAFSSSIAKGEQPNEDSLQSWAFFSFTIIALLCPLLAATTISTEHNYRRLDDLRMTLVRPGQMILAKFTACTATLLPTLLACLICFPLLMTWAGSSFSEWTLMLTALFSVIVSAWLALSASLFASSLCKRIPLALLLAYGLTGLFFLLLGTGAAVLLAIAEDMVPYLAPHMDHPATETLIHAAIFLMPTTAFYENLQLVHDEGGNCFFSLYWFLNIAYAFLCGCGFLVLTRLRVGQFWRTQP